mmetsp:Transcript_159/g.386  ORF Transcript_159/g.386 Transcript_159/m.386 type:complete len:229 (+) Transcript_159:247-933(+)
MARKLVERGGIGKQWIVGSATVGLLSFFLCALVYLPAKSATHLFDPEVLQGIAVAAIAEGKGNVSQTIQATERLVRESYPARYLVDEPEWIFNNAGGAMGSMRIIHSSLSEYLIIFGSPIGTDGHTGRFFADDYFTILYGEQWAYLPSSTEKEVYRPGDQHHLRRGTAKAYRFPDACYALEYARGNIPSMLPFGFADSFFSTLDFGPVWRTVVVSARSTIKLLLAGKV